MQVQRFQIQIFLGEMKTALSAQLAPTAFRYFWNCCRPRTLLESHRWKISFRDLDGKHFISLPLKRKGG